MEALRGALAVEVRPDLLELALVHRSWSYEHGAVPTNERLEFLGDAVLGVVVTDALFRRHPDLPEGQLAKLRSAVVNMRALASVARSLRLGECVRLGRGEESTGGREKVSILADTTEAVIGAAYLSAGMDATRALVLRLVEPLMESSANLGAGLDWKTSLQELTAAGSLGPLEYRVTATGPDHARVFTADAVVAGASAGTGTGGSKKEAEQAAAADAYRNLSGAAGPSAGPSPVVAAARDGAGSGPA